MFDIDGPEGFFMRECFSKERIDEAFKLVTEDGWTVCDACNKCGLDADEIMELDRRLEEDDEQTSPRYDTK